MQLPLDPNFTRVLPPGLSNPTVNGPRYGPRITPNGRFVTFNTKANLGFGSNGKRQVYRYDRSAGESGLLVLVSLGTGGSMATSDCLRSSISDDGQRIVFETTAPLDPVADLNGGLSDIYIRDFRPPTPPGQPPNPPETRLVSRNAAVPSVAGNGTSRFPCISGDGNIIVFTTAATNLPTGSLQHPSDTNQKDDVYRVGATGVNPPMHILSLSDLPTDPLGNGHCRTTDPSVPNVGQVLSTDGRFVVFEGAVNNWNFSGLKAFGPVEQVFVRDMQLGGTSVVSRRSIVVSGIGTSRCPSITPDGSLIAFSSDAGILFDSQTPPPTFETIFIAQRTLVATGLDVALFPFVRNQFGGPPNDACQMPMITIAPITQHIFVSFMGWASDLVPGDTNTARDIFVAECPAEMNPMLTRRFSVTSAGAQVAGPSFNSDITADGRVVVYESLSSELLGPGGDTNGVQDIFETLSPQGPFIRGDATGDGDAGPPDIARINNFLFLGEAAPDSLDGADADDNGLVSLNDSIFLSNFLFLAGPAPSCPSPLGTPGGCCGNDPTPDSLTSAINLPNCAAAECPLP